MVTLALGGVVFQGFEIPASIGSGGSQMLATHKMPGGNRAIDAMGPDDNEISWSGRFRGSSAETRALFLDFMRRQGNKVLLTYSLHFYQVIIKEFRADFQQSYEIPYSISCEVVQDLTQAAGQLVIGLVESLASDAVNAAGLSSLIPNGAINTAVNGVLAGVSNFSAGVPVTSNLLAGASNLASGSLLSGLSGSISGAQTAIQSVTTSVNSSISAGFAAVGSAASSIASSLTNLATGMGQLSTLNQLSSTLGRMTRNIANAGS